MEATEAVAPGCIEAAGVQVLSAGREAAARFGGRWAVARHEDRPVELLCVGRWVVVPRSERPEVLRYAGRWVVAPPSAQAEVLQYADQWAVVPLSGRPAMPPCVGLRATLQLGVPDHTRTFIAGHIPTFTVAPIPIMVPVLSRQVLSPALLLVLQQPPHTTIPITRSPIIRLLVDRRTRPPAQTPIEQRFHGRGFRWTIITETRAGAGAWRRAVLARRDGAEDVKERCMRPRLPRCLSAAFAACVLLPVAAQAQVIPFAGNFGQGLAPSDNQMIFESVARLNAAEPSKVGRSDSWSNPETKSSGTSTILRVFRSGGMACHLVRHHIVAGRPPSRDYRLTWCRTSTGEWKIKG